MLVSRIRISFASACGSPCLGRGLDRLTPLPCVAQDPRARLRSVGPPKIECPAKIGRPTRFGCLVVSLLMAERERLICEEELACEG